MATENESKRWLLLLLLLFLLWWYFRRPKPTASAPTIESKPQPERPPVTVDTGSAPPVVTGSNLGPYTNLSYDALAPETRALLNAIPYWDEVLHTKQPTWDAYLAAKASGDKARLWRVEDWLHEQICRAYPRSYECGKLGPEDWRTP